MMNTQKLQVGEELLMDSDANVHKERRALFMVSVPGFNDWAIEVEKNFSGFVDAVIMETDAPSNGVKRPLDTDITDQPMEDGANDSADLQLKKPTKEATNGTSAEPKGLSREYLLNSPIADRPSKACMAKFYENFSDITLNAVLDVVGFLSVDPSLCASNQQPDEFDNFDEICAMNPPPSLIPRLHVVAFRHMTNLNPILDDKSYTLTPEIKTDAYKDLRIALTQCLFGDAVVADYLLCHLVSTVYVRGEETLGQFSLNITNFPADVLPGYIKQLYEIIELFLPASHYLPVTLDNLNTIEFIPT